MFGKDTVRIGGLGAAIMLGMALQAAPQQTSDWTGPVDRIAPVQVETAKLPKPPGQPA